MTPPPRAVALLLNLAHAVDHLFLLIFATAVAAIAADFGFAHWEDLMPYSVGAFLMFGLASVPAGRLRFAAHGHGGHCAAVHPVRDVSAWRSCRR